MYGRDLIRELYHRWLDALFPLPPSVEGILARLPSQQERRCPDRTPEQRGPLGAATHEEERV